MAKRIVVTGMGIVSPLGNTIESFWNSLKGGISGIGSVTQFDTTDYACKIAGEVKDIDFNRCCEPKEANRTDRSILFALYAAKEAVADAAIDFTKVDTTRCATVLGSGIGGLRFLEVEHEKLVTRGPNRVSPFLIPMMIPDMQAGRVSIEFGLKGPNYAVVSACASGAHAIGDSWMMLRCGMADMAVTGGAEAVISKTAFAGFCNMKAMSTRNDNPQKASSPFDANRDGFVMGEGAGVIVLETLEHALARGAKIYCELVGYGATGDAYHLTSPAPNGEGAARCMAMALKTAGLTPADIDYINAHGTSTDYNDKFETMAMKTVFGDYARTVNISSTKSMTGHLLGASGAIEFVAAVKAVTTNIIPPTINYETPDPECDLNYTPNVAVSKTVRAAMSNNFGFGGHNASLIVKKYESGPDAR